MSVIESAFGTAKCPFPFTFTNYVLDNNRSGGLIIRVINALSKTLQGFFGFCLRFLGHVLSLSRLSFRSVVAPDERSTFRSSYLAAAFLLS